MRETDSTVWSYATYPCERYQVSPPRVSGLPGSSLPTSSQVRCASSGCGTSAFLRHAANAASASKPFTPFTYASERTIAAGSPIMTPV